MTGNADSQNDRSRFWIDYELVGIDGVRQVCAVLLPEIRPKVTKAWIDAFSDVESLPAEAEVALEGLRRIGVRQHEEWLAAGGKWRQWRRRDGPTMMGIDLDVRSDSELRILTDFGPYSINAEVYGDDPTETLITMHDSGTSVTFLWDVERVPELAMAAGVSEAALAAISHRR